MYVLPQYPRSPIPPPKMRRTQRTIELARWKVALEWYWSFLVGKTAWTMPFTNTRTIGGKKQVCGWTWVQSYLNSGKPIGHVFSAAGPGARELMLMVRRKRVVNNQQVVGNGECKSLRNTNMQKPREVNFLPSASGSQEGESIP